MKHIKLFENFEHTKQESREMEDKYNQILNDKAVEINVNRYDQTMTLTPSVRVWSGHNNLNEELSYNLSFRVETTEFSNSRYGELVSLSIHNGGDRIQAWKERYISLENSEIDKILRMVSDAIDYIGGIDMNEVEKELMNKLTK
tara:strand:+ start:73827 stop:74258 length:432 start_codon:yes stop_codon:yes gene_type:complete